MNLKHWVIGLAWRLFRPDARGRGPLALRVIAIAIVALVVIIALWASISFAAVAFGSAAH